MLPTAFCFGELVSFTEDNVGFLDQEKLHTPLYLSINLFAGEGKDCWVIVGSYIRCTGAVRFEWIGPLIMQALGSRGNVPLNGTEYGRLVCAVGAFSFTWIGPFTGTAWIRYSTQNRAVEVAWTAMESFGTFPLSLRGLDP